MKPKMGFRIAPAVLILTVLMLVFDRERICMMTLIAAFLHELGHLSAAGALGIPLRSLRFGFLGARMDVRGRMLSYSEEWLLCAAGPAWSLLSSAFAAVFWQVSSDARVFSCASLVLGLLNLLPIRSFDGGRMTECAIRFFAGDVWADRIMRPLSLIFLFLLWACSVYFLLRAGDGLSLFCFSMSLLLRFFDGEDSNFV